MAESFDARPAVPQREVAEEAPYALLERYEHLRILARVTWLGIPITAFILAPILSVFSQVAFPTASGMASAMPTAYDLIPAALPTLTSYMALFLFDRRRLAYERAAILYVAGLIGGVGLGMFVGSPLIRVSAPFSMVLIVSISGLLLPPLYALLSTIVGGVLILFLTFAKAGSIYDFVALFLVVLAAGIAQLTSGSLYRAVDWAMASYRKSEERADALWRNREELKKALAARDWLNEQLRMTNLSLEQARAVAEEANRLKSQFVANMSHELRTPLNAVINFARIVMEGYAGPVNEEQRSYLGYVRFAGEHLLGLINDILDLAKIEAGKLDIHPEPLDLSPVFKGVMSTAVGLTRDKGLELTQVTPDDLPHVYADAKRIRQVLLNLLSNAAKFTDTGGITLSAEVAGDEVVISVRDTGIGIDPKDYDKVFEEFRQVDDRFARTAGGTGLGIPISKKLLEMHGGRMWFESEVGVGSTFYVTLPVYDSQNSDAEEA